MFTATTCAGLGSKHHDYALLAGRLCIADLHKRTEPSFANWVVKYGMLMQPLHAAAFTNRLTCVLESAASLDTTLAEAVINHGGAIDRAIAHDRDYELS